MLRTRSALAVLLLAPGACGPELGPGLGSAEIVGGEPIEIEEAPWQISLQDDFGHFCGGSILTAEWVITAQHCTEFAGGTSMQVLAGATRLSQPGSGQTRSVAEVVPFPGFRDPTEGKDVALVRLAQPLALDGVSVRAVDIADASSVTAGLTDPGVVSTVSGWGALSSGGPSPDQLQAVDIPLVSNQDAQAAYSGENITDDQLAAGDLEQGGIDSCQGDSGGPLVVPDASGEGVLLAGVVSWGFGCASPNAPGMYARVSSFADFIRDNVGDEPPPPPPPAGGLLLNEVLADPAAGFDANNDGVASTTADEFIELVNTGAGTLDLSGATVSDSVGVRGVLPAGTQLAPGEVLLIFGGGVPNGFEVQTAAFRLALNNRGDTITVAAADGTVLAAMSYGTEGNRNQSMVRLVEEEESAFVLHRSVSADGASPGAHADGTPF
jgi:secreted trypsin-like serine protease